MRSRRRARTGSVPVKTAVPRSRGSPRPLGSHRLDARSSNASIARRFARRRRSPRWPRSSSARCPRPPPALPGSRRGCAAKSPKCAASVARHGHPHLGDAERDEEARQLGSSCGWIASTSAVADFSAKPSRCHELLRLEVEEVLASSMDQPRSPGGSPSHRRGPRCRARGARSEVDDARLELRRAPEAVRTAVRGPSSTTRRTARRDTRWASRRAETDRRDAPRPPRPGGSRPRRAGCARCRPRGGPCRGAPRGCGAMRARR
jgi:hypothetical protein